MPEYDAVYLSPHLDDAALSCGGQIHRRTRAGERVLILTVFAGSEPDELSSLALRVHALFGLTSGVMAVRRREDAEACRVLGAVDDRRELPDAVYRQEPGSGRPLYDDIARLFEPPCVADERELLPRLAALLRELPPSREVFAPLTAGGHVDHRLARRAAEAVWGAGLAYYEDYPYCEQRGALQRALGTPGEWVSEVAPLAPEDLEAKIAAVKSYASQIGPLFGSERRLERRLRRQVRKAGGERVWRRRTASRV